VENCQALAAACIKNGLEVLTGGTDNHLLLVNVRGLDITGRQAESALHECNITVNRNSLPFDPNGPWYTSGLRIGAAAVTTLGMGKADMEELGAIIALVLKGTVQAPVLPAELPAASKDPAKKSKAKYSIDEKTRAEALERVKRLLDRFPVYPELDLPLLKRAFTDS
jgi:glycine hydroxymethyltransferase